MSKQFRAGAAGALLDEYEKAIGELQVVIADVSSTQLTMIVGAATAHDCNSIQAILAHVVSAGYSYAAYIRKFRGGNSERPAKMLRATTDQYMADLTKVFNYTLGAFVELQDSELEQPEEKMKMLTTWGQIYDIEQMMEHAIVHILRHRRQIERLLAQKITQI